MTRGMRPPLGQAAWREILSGHVRGVMRGIEASSVFTVGCESFLAITPSIWEAQSRVKGPRRARSVDSLWVALLVVLVLDCKDRQLKPPEDRREADECDGGHSGEPRGVAWHAQTLKD